ncbi:hypothetical protein SKAU_G00411610 [Synaphobranchus kaupii]|uniref:Transposase n=1 Tax=Synaphobranchus kaupii TaxID=118154 RepID=A0A9Q1IBR2_SYNKA|nr:hypothetical protein SKAU_G00411610 [Synaphobranchus kaupii]
MRIPVPEIAHIFKVSVNTVRRRMQEHDIRVSDFYADIEDTHLDGIVAEIQQRFPNSGYKMVQGHLRGRGLRIQTLRVQQSMRRTDPHGVMERSLCLHTSHLDFFVQGWNNHSIRTARNLSPLQMWHRCLIDEDSVQVCEDYGIDWSGPSNPGDLEDIEVPEIELPRQLTEADLAQLPQQTTEDNESRFTLSTCDRRERVWRRRGERYAACNIIQHDRFGGGSVMVWGGISLEGRTNLHVLANGTLTAVRYRDEILRPIVRPYTGAVGPGFLLVQDNAWPHVARAQFFTLIFGIGALVEIWCPAYTQTTTHLNANTCNQLSYSREFLLELRCPSPPGDKNHRLPPVFLDNIPPELRRPVAHRKRGRRGGIRNRLRRRDTRTPLPSIILSNLRSLNNKVDEIRAYASGKAAQVAATIADCVHKLQQRYLDAAAIVLGALNHCYLDSTLPGFCQIGPRLATYPPADR